jgi:hypothetical protein
MMINVENVKILDDELREDVNNDSIQLINDNKIHILNDTDTIDKYFSNKSMDFMKAQFEFKKIDKALMK